MTANIISINVGGSIYTTNKETLNRYPESTLASMCDEPQAPRDKDGNIFIDRDGKTFRYIINFFRSGQVKLPESRSECRLLEVEAEFYKIKPLIDQLTDRQTLRKYIYVVYMYSGAYAEIHGYEHTLRSLDLPQKYKIPETHASSCIQISLSGKIPHVDPDELSSDLRARGWELHDSSIESELPKELPKEGATTRVTYKQSWYHSSC